MVSASEVVNVGHIFEKIYSPDVFSPLALGMYFGQSGLAVIAGIALYDALVKHGDRFRRTSAFLFTTVLSFLLNSRFAVAMKGHSLEMNPPKELTKESRLPEYYLPYMNIIANLVWATAAGVELFSRSDYYILPLVLSMLALTAKFLHISNAHTKGLHELLPHLFFSGFNSITCAALATFLAELFGKSSVQEGVAERALPPRSSK